MYLQQPDMPENPRVLKISVLGVPNSGKSTLVNRIMNRRVNLLPILRSVYKKLVKFVPVYRLVQFREK